MERDDRIEPPIHTEYFLSGGVITLVLMVDGANCVNSLCTLSPKPGNISINIRECTSWNIIYYCIGPPLQTKEYTFLELRHQ